MPKLDHPKHKPSLTPVISAKSLLKPKIYRSFTKTSCTSLGKNRPPSFHFQLRKCLVKNTSLGIHCVGWLLEMNADVGFEDKTRIRFYFYFKRRCLFSLFLLKLVVICQQFIIPTYRYLNAKNRPPCK